MLNRFKSFFKRKIIEIVNDEWKEINTLKSVFLNSTKGENTKLYPIYRIVNSKIGDYTYISESSIITDTEIGKFCSIGPNLICGWGIHPTNKLSTAPMFYSTRKQNGVSLSRSNEMEERKQIIIGNDVFIGMNVSVLDGITIGDGAIIGAGAVVSKDIPPYAIAVGCPIKIVKFRFTTEQIEALMKISWWNWDRDKLYEVKEHFHEVQSFINKYN